MDMKDRTAGIERDHIDALLDTLHGLPVDLEVEGIIDRIAGLDKRVRRSMEETLAEFDLSHGEFKVLGWLRHGPHSPGELAENADLSSGAMTNRIDQLEKAGLVERTPDPSDRRGIQVSATQKGLDLWLAAFASQTEKEKSFPSTLGAEGKSELNTLLRRLMITLETRVPGDEPVC